MARRPRRSAQQEMTFRTWGGRRTGAGRKQVNARKSEPHRKRKELRDIHPVHVVLRLVRGLGTLRRRDTYQAVRRASFVVLGRPDFRLCHISIQNNHVHLLVEATNEQHLSRGMQAFQISAARRINAAMKKRSGRRRKGTVFVDRYHSEVIDNPRQARNTLVYVLNNWRKHRENTRASARGWRIDPFSTAMAFRGWAEQPAIWRAPVTYERMAVTVPETWLLYGAWQLYDPPSVYDVPSKPKPHAAKPAGG
jgi:REP element-mobilizing transposase RayT